MAVGGCVADRENPDEDVSLVFVSSLVTLSESPGAPPLSTLVCDASLGTRFVSLDLLSIDELGSSGFSSSITSIEGVILRLGPSPA